MDTIKSVLKKLNDTCNELGHSKSHLSDCFLQLDLPVYSIQKVVERKVSQKIFLQPQHDDLQEVTTIGIGISSLSIDDEFEVEFLVENILKSAKTLKKIIHTYPVAEKKEINSNIDEEPKEEKRAADSELNSKQVVNLVLHSDTDPDSEEDGGPESRLAAVNTHHKVILSSSYSPESRLLKVDTNDNVKVTSPGYDNVKVTSAGYQQTGPLVLECDTESDDTVDLDSSVQGAFEDNDDEEIARCSNRDLSALEKSEIEGCLEAFAADALDEDFEDGDDDALFNDNLQDDLKTENEAPPSVAVDDTKKEAESVDEQDDMVVEQKYLSVLKSYFGFSKFRPMQWRIINAVLNDHRDNCVLMATGYGKSLCYQYPSVYTGRTTVVVSPLISLMEDQVLALSAVKIPASFLGSAQDRMAEVRREMLQGKYRVVYITPEFCEVSSDILQGLHSSVGIDLVAIDEAHCVCQWGHDFRKAYRSLGVIRKLLPQVPVMALTATATPDVTKDICKSLGLRNPLLTSTGFDRVNLFLSASKKSGDIVQDLRSRMIRQGNKYVFEGSVIVYCPTKKATEDIHRAMTVLGVKSAIYHAGLSKSARRKTHQQFVNDEIQVVVATVAFGMGIDKPDVRQVIHYGAPKDIESYYQEMGRAGRDGGPATCHAFYSGGDFNTNQFLLKDIQNKLHYEHRLKMLRKMMDYLPSTQCRRRLILVHFDDHSSVRMRPSCCDNCRQALVAQAQGQEMPDLSKPTDYGSLALDLFKAIEVMHNPRGLGTYCMFLLGSATEKVQRYSSNPLFGKYKSQRSITKKFLQALGRQLVSEGYLCEEKCEGFFGTVVSLKSKGRQFLQSNQANDKPILMLVPTSEMVQLNTTGNKARPAIVCHIESSKVILPTVPTGEWLSTSELQARSQKVGDSQTPVLSDKDKLLMRQLLAKLMSLRNDIANDNGLNSVNVFTNKALSEMASTRPTKQASLSTIDGVALQRVNLYGESFVSAIKEFCTQHDWSTDVQPQKEEKIAIKFTGAMEQAYAGLTDTCQNSYCMFEKESRSLEDVALTRGIKTSTVCSHLASCIEAGLPVDIRRLGMTDKVQQQIERTIRGPSIKSDISRLMPIKEQLPDYFTFDQIKLVIAIMKRRFGLTNCNFVAEEAATEHETPTKQSSLLQFAHHTDNTPKLSRHSSAPSSQRDSTDQRSASYTDHQPSQSQAGQWSASQTGQGSAKKRSLPPSLLKTSSLSKKQKTEKMKKNSLFAR